MIKRYKKKLAILLSAVLVFSMFLPVNMSMANGYDDGTYYVEFLHINEATEQGLPVGAIVSTTTSSAISLELLSYKFELDGNVLGDEDITRVDSSYDSVRLLGYMNTEGIEPGSHTLTLKGYDGDTEVISRSYLIDNFSVNMADISFQSWDRDYLKIDIHNKIVYSQEDINGRNYDLVVISEDDDYEIARISGTVNSYGYDTAFGVHQTWLDMSGVAPLNSHVVYPGEKFKVLVEIEGEEPFEFTGLEILGKNLNAWPRDRVYIGDTEFSATVSTMNFPNKDYYTVSVIEKDGEEEILIAEAYESHYTSAYTEGVDDNFNSYVKFRVVEGKTLEAGKRYYFKFESEHEDLSMFKNSSFEVVASPTIVDVDTSRLNESKLILDTVNFDDNKAYEILISNQYYSQGSPEPEYIASATGFVNDGIFEFDLKDSEQNPVTADLFSEEASYYFHIKDNSEFLLSNNYLHIYRNYGVINSVYSNYLSLNLSNYFERIEIEEYPFVAEDIESIELVEAGNEENVVAIANGDISVEGIEYFNAVETEMQITGQVETNVDYIYVVTLKNGDQIRPRYSVEEEQKEYYVTINFVDDVVISDMFVLDGINIFNSYEETTYLELSSDSLEFDLYNIVNLKEEDLTNLEVDLLDGDNNVVASMNRESIEVFDNGEYIDALTAQINLQDVTLEEDTTYTIVVSYSSNEQIVQNLIFTSEFLAGWMNILGENTFEKDKGSFEVVLDDALNFDAETASLVLAKRTPNYGYDLDNAIELEAEVTADELNNRYYLKSSLEGKNVPVGYYAIFLKQKGNIITEDYPQTNIRVTDKSMVLRSSEYVSDEGVVTEYIIQAVNLERDATYKVYVYPGYYDDHRKSALKSYYEPDPELIMTLDQVTIDEDGNILFTAEELKGLKGGSYSLFFEMNNRVIGQGYLDVKEYSEVQKASFMINGGRKATDNPKVALQIMLGSYSQIKIAESEAALSSAAYESVTSEELANKVALRDFIMSSSLGQKTIYIQLKDNNGKESEVLSQSISLESEVIEQPFDLKYTGNDPIVENDTIVIEAKGKQQSNVVAKASLLDAEGNILSTVTLPNVGKDLLLNNIYKRSILVSGNLVNVSTIRVYFENSLGNKSESIDINLSVSKLAKVDGTLNRTHADETTAVAYASVILEKKSEDSFVRVASRTTDKDGKFTFTGLADGDYRFVTYHSGIEYTKEFSISGSDIEQVFTLVSEFDKSQAIKVILEDSNGVRLEGKNIAIGSSRAAIYQNKATDKNGEALFENLPTKDEGVEYYVSTYVDGLGDWKYIELKPNEPAEVTLTLPTVSIIKGKVADQDGNPMKDVTVYANSESFRYSYAYTDENGEYELKILDHKADEKYRVQVSLNSAAKLFPVEIQSNVEVGTENVNFTLYPGVNVYGDIKNAAGEKAANISVWASSSSQWNSSRTNENGEFDFGDSFGIGTHTVSAWVDGQQVSQSIEVTKEDLQSDVPVSKKVELRAEDTTSHPFKGEGNSIRSNVSSIQKEKQFTVKVNLKNNSTRALEDVELEATLPENVVLVDTPGFDNVSSKNLGTIEAEQSGEMTLILKAESDFDSSSITIPVKAKVGANEYNLGFAEIEVVNISITGPTLSRSGNITVYGETVEGGKVTIIDKATGKAIASTTPKGKWYSSNLTLVEGDYEIIAMVEKDSNTAYSDILNVKVSAAGGIEVADVEIVSPGGQKIGLNRRTGIAAFSVWVDMSLRGKDIDARVKLDSAPGVIQEAKYSFAGKEYTATKDSQGYYKAKITGWSATGNQKLKLLVKVEDKWIEFVVGDITILIDPSGYVEDKRSLERLEGALAICEVWDEGEGKWNFWDAEIYGQVNPQLTDSNGEYGWMVPDGKYRVKLTKDGYEDYITTEDEKYSADGDSTIIIPPPRDDVFISMVNISQPTVQTVSINGRVITFALNKAIDKSTVTNQTVVVKDELGAVVSGSVSVSSNNKNIIFTSAADFSSEKEYSLSVEGVKDFAGTKTEAKDLVYVGTVTSEKITTPGGEDPDDGDNENPGGETPGGNTPGSGGGGGGTTTSGGTTIKSSEGGSVKVDGLVIDFLGEFFGKDIIVKVKKLDSSEKSKLTLPAQSKFASDVFDITKNVQGEFSKPVTITIQYSSNVDLSKENLSLFWLDESKNEWIELEDVKIDAAKRTISGKVNHFTKFAAISKTTLVEEIKQPEIFSDIVNHWAKDNILELVKLGAISGYEDKTFKPNRNITRAEFTSVLVNALDLTITEGKVFGDTKEHWAKDAIATAYANKIIGGYDDVTFGPNDLVTREQMATMIVNAFKLKPAASLRTFNDAAAISSWAKESVDIASSHSIINGYPDGSFGPKKNATRAEAVTIIVGALKQK